MNQVMVPIAVGSTVTTVEELDALPVFAVIIADPNGDDDLGHQRHMVLQKHLDANSKPSWYAARPISVDDLAASEEDAAVHGAHYGPFLVLWLPPAGIANEAAA